MQDYYSRYLPQMTLSATIPVMILITLFPITGMNHKKSYPDIFMVAVVVPVIALITIILIGSTVGSF